MILARFLEPPRLRTVEAEHRHATWLELFFDLVLVGMFAVAALATNVHGAFEHGGVGFAVSYVVVRLVIVGLYVRAGWILCASVAVAMAGLAAIQLATPPARSCSCRSRWAPRRSSSSGCSRSRSPCRS